MDYDIKELHNILQEILDYVVNVCEENTLRYTLAYGTALGAFRHDGFIPWDDDLDIAMPRDDYNKLREILHSSDNKTYSIQDVYNEKNYYLQYIKVRKNNTIFIEETVDGKYKNNGVWIDIFPLDNVKSPNGFIYKKNEKLASYFIFALALKNLKNKYKKDRGVIRYIIDRIICFPSLFLSNKALLKILENICINNDENLEYLACYGEATNAKIMRKDIYFPTIKHSFNNKQYDIPGKIEEYLKISYGDDYMKLPPEEKRRTHKPIKVKF